MPTGAERTSAVRSALRRGPVARLVIAFACSAIADWALWGGVLVFAYDHGGASAAGFASLGMLVPVSLLALVAGRVADGPRPNRVLVRVYSAQACLVVALTLATKLGAPPLVIVAVAAMSISLVCFVRPSIAVIGPGLVRSALELTGLNVAVSYAESTSVLLGPLLAAIMLAVAGPWLVFAACAVLVTTSALVTRPLLGVDAAAPTSETSPRGFADLRNSLRTLRATTGMRSLLAVLATQYALIGAFDLLCVVLAFDVLGLGAAGPGTLTAVFGVGALIGSASSTVLIGRRRLASLTSGALVLVVTVLCALGAWPVLAVAIVVLVLVGVSRSMLDLTGRMLLQRTAPQEALASVFAILEVIAGVGIATGSLTVQVVIAAAGPRVALVALAAIVAVVAAFTLPGLRAVEARADVPVVVVRLLRRMAIFAPLAGPELEAVARSGVQRDLSAGTSIITQGEVGDSYFAILDGVVEVSRNGVTVRTMGRAEGFGEVALLSDEPRTASVTAATDVSVIEIDRVSFLTTVTGHDAAARSAWAIAGSWPDRSR